MPHEDGPLYHPAAAIVSLGSWAVLRFYAKRSEDDSRDVDEEEKTEEGEKQRGRKHNVVFSVALAPRSLVVFTGKAYTCLLHGIEAVAEEELDASVLNKNEEEVIKASVEKKEASSSSSPSPSSSSSPSPSSPSSSSPVRFALPRGGGGEQSTGSGGDRVSLTVRRVLRVRRNLLARLGPRVV